MCIFCTEYLALNYLIRTMYSKLECRAHTCALRAYSTGCLNIPGKLKNEFEIALFYIISVWVDPRQFLRLFL